MKSLDLILAEENLTKETFQNMYDRFWYSKEARNKMFELCTTKEEEKEERQFILECGKQVYEHPETKEEVTNKLVERYGEFTGVYFFNVDFCKEQYERTLEE